MKLLNKQAKADIGNAIMWIVFILIFIVFIGKMIPGFWDELAVGVLGITTALKKIGKK